MDLLAIGGVAHQAAVALAAEAEPAVPASGLQINLFWIIVAAANFLILFVILAVFAFGPLRRILDERRERIEQGLKDADQARRDRESAEAERLATLAEARKESNDILTRAQKVAQESRDTDIAATKAELERMRERAAADIEAEKKRAIAEIRGEVADLALRAASKVVGETMTDDRQRQLV
ncbi:MAG TPA: F0F1 ATP synthase subunit B, partial [Candidatus Limnocylindrales bacterium]